MTCKRDNHPLLIAKRVCPPNCFVADERLRNLTRKRLATWRRICGHRKVLALVSGLKANEFKL